MEPIAYLEMASVEQDHWWFAGRRTICSSVIDQLRLPAGARILEVGSGTGGNLELLRTYGEVTAIEMDPSARAYAARVSGIDVLPGVLPSGMPPLTRSFDLICLFDVLEHIGDHEEALRQLEELLAPGGRLIVTVPAHQWLWSPHDERLHHRRRYSRASLDQVVQAAGLAVQHASFFNMLLFPVAVLSRHLDAMLKPSRPSGTVVPPRAVNALLTAVLVLEAKLLRVCTLPYGLSLLLVARRRTSDAV